MSTQARLRAPRYNTTKRLPHTRRTQHRDPHSPHRQTRTQTLEEHGAVVEDVGEEAVAFAFRGDAWAPTGCEDDGGEAGEGFLGYCEEEGGGGGGCWVAYAYACGGGGEC